MKVIFLDIDGVLNTVVDSPKIWIRGRGFHFNIDFSLIPSLKQILELCLNKDIKIIVTSANALNKMMRKEAELKWVMLEYQKKNIKHY